MSGYTDFITSNRDKVIMNILHVINDETLSQSFYRESNVFCDGVDFYISSDFASVAFKNKRECRKFLSRIGGKMRLTATNNSMGRTRLIYEVTLK